MQVPDNAQLLLAALSLAALSCAGCHGHRLPENQVFEMSNLIKFPTTNTTLKAYENFQKIYKKMENFDIEKLIGIKAEALILLHQKRQVLRDLLNKESIVKYTSSGASIASSTIGILGAALAPFTGGSSLLLTAGSAVLGTAGAATDVAGEFIIDNYEAGHLKSAHSKNKPLQSAYLALEQLTLDAAKAYTTFQAAILRDLQHFTSKVKLNCRPETAVEESEAPASNNAASNNVEVPKLVKIIRKLDKLKEKVDGLKDIMKQSSKFRKAAKRLAKFFEKAAKKVIKNSTAKVSYKALKKVGTRVLSSTWAMITGVANIVYDSYQISATAATNRMGSETLNNVKGFITLVENSCEDYEESFFELRKSFAVFNKIFVRLSEDTSHFAFDLGFFQQFSANARNIVCHH